MQFSGKKDQINFLGDVLILKSKNIYLCNCLVYHAGKYGFLVEILLISLKVLNLNRKTNKKSKSHNKNIIFQILT